MGFVGYKSVGVCDEFAVAQGFEAQFFINAGNHGILGGLQIFTLHGFITGFLGGGNHFVDDEFFHAALENTAAHEPGVDEKLIFLLFQNHGADQAVVTEFVPQSKIQGDILVVGGNVRNFLLGIANGAQVELVG